MRKNILIPVFCFLSVFLISCATVQEPKKIEQKEEWEYGRLVMMGDEFVGWFSTDLKLIGPGDMEEYFQKNDIEPVEKEVLEHFASLGWEVVRKSQKDRYTTEYRLKRIVNN